MIDHNNALEFPETGQWVLEPFRSFWLNNGGLPLFGYPIRGAVLAAPPQKVIQYFERARFELDIDPSTGQPSTGIVMLGRVGAELLGEQEIVATEWKEWVGLYHPTNNPGPIRPK